jgi:hypothetical protein
MTIKKIFSKIFDEEIHSDFLKFGKGEYRNKYLIDAKKQKDKWIIKTGPEFANYLVRAGLEKANGRVSITGVIVSTLQLDIAISKDLKQFMGIKQYKLDGEFDSSKILEIMDKYPRAFFALTFSLSDYELKIKAKAPKSAKPSTKGESDPKAEFCTIKTTDEKIASEIFFNVPSFKEVSIRHTIQIDQIVYPKDFAKMKPEDVREQSKRKGKIIREVIIDGKSEKSEADFEA